MGVYIPSIKMPGRCDECPMRAAALAWCQVLNISTSHHKTGKPRDQSVRPKECPLVNVSTPHGRLIDADKIAAYLDIEYEIDGKCVVIEDLSDIPIIIESEEE